MRFTPGVLGLLAFALTFHPSPVRAQRAKIVDVKVIGNRLVETDAILGVMVSRKGDEYNRDNVTADRAAIEAMGFFRSVDIRTETRDDGVVLIVEVFENPEIKKIVITGNTVFKEDELLKLLTDAPGKVLNNRTMKDDVNAIEEHYRSQGYLAQVVNVDVDKDGVITITVQEAVIEAIRIEGLHKTKPEVVRREMDVKPGDVFNSKRLSDDLNRIFNLNIFEDVTYERRAGSSLGKIILVLQLKEKKTGTAAVGVGFSSRSELVGFADLNETNFRGEAQTAGVRVEFGDVRSYDFNFFDPWINKKHTSAGINVYNRLIYREPQATTTIGTTTAQYEERRKGFQLTSGRPVSHTTSYSIRLKDETASFTNTQLAPQPLPFGDVSGRVTSITLSGVHDTRDIYMDPTRGGRQSLSMELARPIFGGNSRFVRWDIDLRQYHAVSPKNILAARVLLGLTSGTLPAFEQYFLGGAETLRGYNIDTSFGDYMALTNIELRHRFQKNLQVVGFFDYGDAWGGPFASKGSFSGLAGYGIGLRVQTPVGPIRLDLGIGKQGTRTHFSIGQMF